MKKETNAIRFLNCYNTLDSTLRSIYSIKRSLTYSEVIRKTAPFSSVVKKYEEDLIDYGRLRNAIVHNDDPNIIIAEPHEEVVKKFEFITKLITTPPLVINIIKHREVVGIGYSLNVKNVMEIMYKTNYSNLPVYKDNLLIGVLNGQRIIDSIGRRINNGEDVNEFLSTASAESIIAENTSTDYYTIVDEKITIEEMLNLFDKNRKLSFVLITKGENKFNMPIGIVTTYDLIDLQKVLDVY